MLKSKENTALVELKQQKNILGKILQVVQKISETMDPQLNIKNRKCICVETKGSFK